MDFDWSLDLFISFFIVDNDDFEEKRKFSVWIEIQDQVKRKLLKYLAFRVNLSPPLMRIQNEHTKELVVSVSI